MNNLFADLKLELSFTCPACKKNFPIPVDYTETSFPCPHCGYSVPLSEEDFSNFAQAQSTLEMVRKKTESL